MTAAPATSQAESGGIVAYPLAGQRIRSRTSEAILNVVILTLPATLSLGVRDVSARVHTRLWLRGGPEGAAAPQCGEARGPRRRGVGLPSRTASRSPVAPARERRL
jgi:hypothetical protein